MSQSSPWLPRGLPRTTDRIRLFCFPHAGAGASAYFTWHAQLAPWLSVYPIEIPGRETRFSERPFQSASALAAAVMTDLRQYLDVPFALFGHSMGALISFELARILESAGILPAKLFVSARRAPHLPSTTTPVELLSDDQLLSDLRTLGGVPETALANLEWQQLALPLIRSDFALNDNYLWTGGALLHTDIAAMCGTNDPHVSIEQVSAWSSHTMRRFSLNVIRGDHFFVKSAPASVFEIIRRELGLPS